MPFTTKTQALLNAMSGSSSSSSSSTTATTMTILPLLIIIIITIITIITKRSGKRTSSVSGPPALPLLGNTLTMLQKWENLLEFYVEFTKLYGGESGFGTWKMSVLFQPDFYITHDPKNVEWILTRIDTYGKGPIFRSK